MIKYKKYKNVDQKTLKALYEKMLQIRLATEALREHSLNLELKCPVHFSLGQEASSTGVGLNLNRNDSIVTTHRSHAPYLSKGAPLDEMIAEIYNKKGGSVFGIGGSMQLSSPKNNVFCTSIVSGSISIAVGLALSYKMKKKRNVSVSFFGDGASEEGSFYESLNFASLKKLPVIFFCENNLYSVHAHINNTHANNEIYKLALSNNMPSFRIDGNNVLEVYTTVKKAVDRARKGDGPTFIESMTYRWLEHVGPRFDHVLGFRSEEEVQKWMKNCPLIDYEAYLLKKGILTEARITKIKNKIMNEINDAWKYMNDSSYPKLKEVNNF